MNAISFSDLRASLGAGTILVDVRRKAAFQAAGETIAGALRRDPDAVADWRKTLPRASDVVVYCVHGHEVDRKSTRLNSSHLVISYAVFCLKKKKQKTKAAMG